MKYNIIPQKLRTLVKTNNSHTKSIKLKKEFIVSDGFKLFHDNKNTEIKTNISNSDIFLNDRLLLLRSKLGKPMPAKSIQQIALENYYANKPKLVQTNSEKRSLNTHKTIVQDLRENILKNTRNGKAAYLSIKPIKIHEQRKSIIHFRNQSLQNNLVTKSVSIQSNMGNNWEGEDNLGLNVNPIISVHVKNIYMGNDYENQNYNNFKTYTNLG